MIKFREQLQNEDRKDYMLKVAAEYIREYCPGEIIYYDGDRVPCDGDWVANDCESATMQDEDYEEADHD